MNVLAISLDQQLFNPGSDVFRRHQFYASYLSTYQVIVLNTKANPATPGILGKLRVFPANSNNKFSSICDAVMIASRLARTTRFDLVTVQDPFATGVIGVMLKFILKLPLNVQVHSDFFGTRYFRDESVFSRFLYHLGLLILTQADTVRARNTRIFADITRRFTRLRGHVGYIGQSINPMFLQPVGKDPRTFGMVVSVGRLVKQKNFPVLIQAFKTVREKVPAAKLFIVGDGPEKGNLNKLASDLNIVDAVIFSGQKSPGEIKELLDQTALFVLSSNHEGWGLVCLEALSRGTPVVMTDTGCAGEIVIDGQTGYVVPVGDVRCLADKIALALTNNNAARKLAMKGRELVYKDSSEEKIKRDMLALFNKTTSLQSR